MSRMPPVPSASQPAYGPGAVPKDFVTDLSHHTDLPFQRPRQQPDQERSDGSPTATSAKRAGTEPERPGDDLGGTVPRSGSPAEPWMLIAFGVVVATILWLAGRQKGSSST